MAPPPWAGELAVSSRQVRSGGKASRVAVAWRRSQRGPRRPRALVPWEGPPLGASAEPEAAVLLVAASPQEESEQIPEPSPLTHMMWTRERRGARAWARVEALVLRGPVCAHTRLCTVTRRHTLTELWLLIDF